VRVISGRASGRGPSGERVRRDGVAAGSCRQAGWPFYAGGVPTLTFLFTDIEGSTVLLQRLGDDGYAQVLAGHHALIRSALAVHDGREVDTQGDAFFAVFSSPRACVAAVLEMQQAIAGHAWPGGEPVRVRMGIHCGEAARTATGLVGLEVHRAARVAAVGHGGQVLVSEAAAGAQRSFWSPGNRLFVRAQAPHSTG
jgi:class 3 adenylate cyclase